MDCLLGILVVVGGIVVGGVVVGSVVVVVVVVVTELFLQTTSVDVNVGASPAKRGQGRSRLTGWYWVVPSSQN